jgi:hypothetical protein
MQKQNLLFPSRVQSIYIHSNIIQGENTTKNKYFKI